MSKEDFVLVLDGGLTTSRSEPVRAAMLEALRGHDSVSVDCSGVDEVDVAGIQILIAAGRAASASGKAIRFASPPTGPLAEALARCGFPASGAGTTSLTVALSL